MNTARVIWRILLAAVLLAGLAACEVDNGDEEGDGGTDVTGGDVGGDAAQPICTDDTAFQASCLATFLSCYDPAGTCDEVPRTATGNFTDVTATVFDNEAEWVVRYDAVTGNIEADVVASGGAMCATGAGSEDASGEQNVLYTLSSDGSTTLRIEIDGSGNMRVTCPDDSEETFTAAEAAPVLQCAGFTCGS